MIDFDKFSRYSRPGPRYTSYPTAVEFHEGYDYKAYVESLHTTAPEKKLSLYVHLPFCKSACYFCGCNVIYTSKEEKKTRYITYLEKEIALLAKALDTSLEVNQLHFGGGTPTFFSPAQIDEIFTIIKKYFINFAPGAEIGIEIDPRYFDNDYMTVFQKHGVNRLSFGVQDFDRLVQESVNRIQDIHEIQKAFEISRNAGINSINVDLIYGLPHQSLESFAQTLENVAALDPDRLAVFNYAHVPWMKKTMRKIDETTLPHPSEKLKILKHTIAFFKDKGYKMIGMDHFAKSDDELYKALAKEELHRNFQGYTTNAGAVMIGLGVTSIGEGDDFYAQNYKDLESYEKAIDNGQLPVFRGIKLTEDDILRKTVIMEMMSNFHLKFAKIEQKFGIDFKAYFQNELRELQEFQEAELIEVTEHDIKINDTGIMLIRNIVMPFDAHLKKLPENSRRFSKTV